MINKELLQQVRDKIASEPENFDWKYFECGTQACIAGWICRLADKDHYVSSAVAADLLGIGDDLGNFLFYGRRLRDIWESCNWDDLSNEEMHAEALRRIDYMLALPDTTSPDQEKAA